MSEPGHQSPLFGVQTPPEGIKATGQGVEGESAPVCLCGCEQPVPRLPNGKWAKWAKDGCRQRHWNAKNTAFDLSMLSPAKQEQAKRMMQEALKAARMGQKRATVDAERPVSHEAAAERPDTRPSCRVRLSPDTWDDLQILADIFGDKSRSAVVERLVGAAVSRLLVEIAPDLEDEVQP